MRRRRLIAIFTTLVVSSVVFVTAGQGAAPRKSLARYCTPDRDVCFGVVSKLGATYFVLTTEQHYFGRYRLCVSGGAGLWRCDTYHVRRIGWLGHSSVKFAGSLENVGSGPYRVKWSLGPRPLGPTLRFELP